MTSNLWFQMSANLLGGLAIFLFGMTQMSEGMQAVAGERLRRLIRAVTDNRFKGVAVGTAVTCLLQSSSITTVMVIGLVNAGFMTLKQSIGVILGADIGTTITAWIVALNVLDYGLPLVGIATYFFLFSKNERVRYTAMMIMGVGLIFFGLFLMKNGVRPLRDMPEFRAWFAKYSPVDMIGILRCVLVGIILTVMVQSSSATVGITLVLASEGTIDFPTAIALVVGENIGTTVTAFLASLGASNNAKRSAYAHILVKVIGALWVIPLLPLIITGIRALFPNLESEITVGGVTSFPHVMGGIALFHTAFNVLNVLLFIPFVAVVAQFLIWFKPGVTARETGKLTYLDVRMLEAPAIGIQQSHDEVVRMGEKVDAMLDDLGTVLQTEVVDEDKARAILKGEEHLDGVQREIVIYLSRLLSGNVPHDVVDRARMQLRMADEYESISDYAARILKMQRKLQRTETPLSPENRMELLDLHGRVFAFVKKVNQAVRAGTPDSLSDLRADAELITDTMKDYRDKHLAGFAKEASPLSSLVFTDSLTAYRRIRSHTLNIAQAIGGEK